MAITRVPLTEILPERISTVEILEILKGLQAEEFPCVGISKEGALNQINDRLLGEILFERGRQTGLAQIIKQMEAHLVG